VRHHDVRTGDTLKEVLHYHERKVILERLSQRNWDKDETARDLGIDLATLYRKMKKLGIESGGRPR
jgi:DNA-binding NtrC family response regulator